VSESPFRVVIVGGGVAGLETLMALHALAGDRVELGLVAPENEFVYRPLGVEEPFQVGRLRRVSLDGAARDAGAAFVAGTVEAVDSKEQAIITSGGGRLPYDALVLAVGAEPEPVVDHAMTWDDRTGSELIGGLTRDFEQGYSQSLAVVIPAGPGWPLRGYELALVITLQATGMGMEPATTVVVQEPSALSILGAGAVDVLRSELTGAGISVVSAAAVEVDPGRPTGLLLHPSGRRVDVDRVIALPTLHGRPITGIPTDADGFIETDERGRVLDGVWAAGDGTAFPVKSGGFAAEQADVVAENVAAAAGADIQPRRIDPIQRADLAGLPAGRYLEAWLAVGDDEGLTTHLPSGRLPVLCYLQRDLGAGWRGDE
jgi:sulfide:quinone oxidoreductase